MVVYLWSPLAGIQPPLFFCKQTLSNWDPFGLKCCHPGHSWKSLPVSGQLCTHSAPNLLTYYNLLGEGSVHSCPVTGWGAQVIPTLPSCLNDTINISFSLSLVTETLFPHVSTMNTTKWLQRLERVDVSFNRYKALKWLPFHLKGILHHHLIKPSRKAWGPCP